MGFRAGLPLVRRLILLALAGWGAQLAWQAGYIASFALCLGLVVWATARIAAGGWNSRVLGLHAEERAWSAVLEREREARRLTAFVDHAPVPLLAMRSRGALSAINLSARRMFATDDVLVDPPAALEAAALGATPGVRQTLVLTLNGSARTYALTAAEVVSDGDFVRIIALVDIQAEVQVAEAAAMRELMQVLSHEIMNSLTPVTSLAQSTSTLLDEAERGDQAALAEAREAIDSLARRSEGLLRFVGAYRALARLPEPRLTEVDLAELIGDLARLFRSRWGERIALTTDAAEAGVAMIDQDLMFQALANMLTNAAEVARSEGVDPLVVLAATRAADGRLVLSVSDNGVGIDQPDPAIVLRPFFTTKPTGDGVGLSIARQVALAHGGEIAVFTGPEGTRITLTL